MTSSTTVLVKQVCENRIHKNQIDVMFAAGFDFTAVIGVSVFLGRCF